MIVASWNVNSIRVRLPQVLDWLAAEQPDVLCLQETKVPDAEFPFDAFHEAGYEAIASGQRTYNGVAMVSRRPPENIIREIATIDNEQKRVLVASYDGVRVVNVYVPNGSEVGSEKYAYKLGWFTGLKSWLQGELKLSERLLLLGDFNVAPEDRDVYDPEGWRGSVLVSDAERAALRELMDLGLVDVFRQFEQPEESYSWWDYRAAAFRRNHGLRIDLILCSPTMASVCQKSWIDKGPRQLERPSDHAPVVAEFSN
jgi:exodeoxyribonuclease-3